MNSRREKAAYEKACERSKELDRILERDGTVPKGEIKKVVAHLETVSDAVSKSSLRRRLTRLKLIWEDRCTVS